MERLGIATLKPLTTHIRETYETIAPVAGAFLYPKSAIRVHKYARMYPKNMLYNIFPTKSGRKTHFFL